MKKNNLSRIVNLALPAGVLFCAASLLTAQASTVVTFSVDVATSIAAGTFTAGTDYVEARGSFNGWAGGFQLVQQGSSTVYTNTITDTADANGTTTQYKFIIDGSTWENPYSGGNRAALLPATSGASLVLPTPFFSDGGTAVSQDITFQIDLSQQIALGSFTTGGADTVEVRSAFNGWSGTVQVLTNDPSILRTNQYGLVSANVYVGTYPVSGSPAAAESFKYAITHNGNDNWETPGAANQDGWGNRQFALVTQTLPVVYFADAAYAPIVTNLQFSVDMSIVVLTDTNFNAASLTINGDLMGWGGIAMTNNPTAANTNLYTCIQSYSDGVGAAINYQFRYTLLSDSTSIVYDHANGANGGQNNRMVTVPNASNTNFLSVFNDAAVDDYLLQSTPVLFSVDMNGAVGTDAHPFDPANDAVYINGSFANWYTWGGGVNPSPAPGSTSGAGAASGPYLMVEQGTSTIYTNTIIIPPGPITLSYKYGIDAAENFGGPVDNEAGYGLNHIRVVRSTVSQPYVMAKDTFGKQYSEPYFSSSDTTAGRLTLGQPVAGKVQVSWLGRPGAHLQACANLAGAWQDLTATDGTNWTTGFSSTNGFVSVTNWPATDKTFFRLVKP